MPVSAAGTRIDAPPSVPVAAATIPAATAAALPPLEPPGERVGSCGFAVRPNVALSVNVPHSASSGRFVLPTTIAPASRRRRTIGASSAARLRVAAVPKVVTSPATSVSSLTAIGTPRRGPSARPPPASASARSARTIRKAFSAGSRRSIAARHASTSSRGLASPERTRAAEAATPGTRIQGPVQGRPPVVGTAISGKVNVMDPTSYTSPCRDRPLGLLGGNHRRPRPDALCPECGDRVTIGSRLCRHCRYSFQ